MNVVREKRKERFVSSRIRRIPALKVLSAVLLPNSGGTTEVYFRPVSYGTEVFLFAIINSQLQVFGLYIVYFKSEVIL